MIDKSLMKDPTIGPDNGLSSGRRQAFILTYARILLIGPFKTTFIVEIYSFYSGKCIWKFRLENGGLFVSVSMCLVIEAKGLIYPSVNRITGSHNGLSPD